MDRIDKEFLQTLTTEGEGEVAVFSAKSWDRRNSYALIESATPCHDAQRCWWDLNSVRLTVEVSGLQHSATTLSNC